MKFFFVVVGLVIMSWPMGYAVQAAEEIEALVAAHQKTIQGMENEIVAWQARLDNVNAYLLSPSAEDRAAAVRVVASLRQEQSLREELLAVDLEVVAADGKSGRPIYFSRPFNDLAAEMKYADRMIGILEDQLKGARAQYERLSRLAEAWKEDAGTDQDKLSRIDRWTTLMNRELELTEKALALYQDREQPGWYDQANLVAKYDLPMLQYQTRAARAAIDRGLTPLQEKQLQSTLNVMKAGRTTTEAMAEFNARMTRESPLIEHEFDETLAVPESVWNLEKLSAPPIFRWLDDTGPVRQVLYRGEPYQGKPTDVFAYYATPGTLAGDSSLDKDLPALVLVHGGGDRAFLDWVTFWAGKGYAAIAMDLAGCGPNADGEYDKLHKPERLLRGGPGQDGKCKILDINLPLTDQWPYHAVANVIRAHSLVRSLPGINPDRTGIAGISWGGYLTCIAAGVDPRFKAAMPFYGCGFLAENSVWKDMGLFDELGEARTRRWTDLWDPSNYAGKINIPVFAVTGAKDFAYPLESFVKTYALPKGPVQFRVTPDMGHGAQFLTTTPEAVVFMDSILRGGAPLPSLRTPQVDDDKIATDVFDENIVDVQFHYTTTDGPNKTREWKKATATLNGKTVSAERPSSGFTIGYFTVATESGTVVSSTPLTPTAKR